MTFEMIETMAWMALAFVLGWRIGVFLRDQSWKEGAQTTPDDPAYLNQLWVGDASYYVVRCDDLDKIEALYRDVLSIRRAQEVINRTLGKDGPRVSTKEKDGRS